MRPAIVCAIALHLLTALSASPAIGARGCEQTIEFGGVFQGSNLSPASRGGTAFVIERVAGGCLQTNYIFLDLGDESIRASVIEADFDDTSIENAMRDGARRHRVPPRGRAHDIRRSIAAPPRNAELLADFAALEPVPDVLLWNEARGAAGIDAPTSALCRLEVLYWWPRGLYIDYAIESLHVLSEEGEGLILVVTHNPAPVEGADSRHGFLVVRGTTPDGS